MTTAGKLRQVVRNYLFSNYPGLRPKRIPGQIATVVTGDHPGVGVNLLAPYTISDGDVFEVEGSGELLWATHVHGTSNTYGQFTVMDRFYNGTKGGELSIGTQVRLLVNPRFTRQQIDDAIIYILEDLERNRVFKLETATFRVGEQVKLPGFIEGLSLYITRFGRVEAYPFKNIGVGPDMSAVVGEYVNRYLPQCDFHILYRKKILRPEDLLPRQVPIVPVGVAAELLSQTVIDATADPGRRTDRTVQAGQELRDALNLRRMYLDRVGREAQLLKVEKRRQVSDLFTESVEKFRA